MARSLQASGLDVGHEIWGKDGISHWRYAAPGQYTPDPEMNYKTLHIIRHPLRCAASFQTATMSSWKFLSKYIPLDLAEPLAVRCLKHWLWWNRLCQRSANLTVRIEQIDQDPVHVFFERTIDFGKVSSNYNSRTYTPIDWDVVFQEWSELATEIFEEAALYGYEL